MLPNAIQRILMLAAIVLVAWWCSFVATEARVLDGSQGMVLIHAQDPIRTAIVFASVLILGAVVCGVVGAWGNPLAGVFSLCAAFAWTATQNGPIDSWLRTFGSPYGYQQLAAETGLWLAMLAVALHICYTIGVRLHGAAPTKGIHPDRLEKAIDRYIAVLRHHRIGPTEDGESELPDDLHDLPIPKWKQDILELLAVLGVGVLVGWLLLTSAMPERADRGLVLFYLVIAGFVLHRISRGTNIAPTWLHLCLGPAVTIGLGSALSWLFLRSSEPWQVAWGLAISYGIGAGIAHHLFPKALLSALLLAPIIAGAGWYLLISRYWPDHDIILEAHFQKQFWTVGLVLPIYYASAGVCGAAAGIGASQVAWYGRIDDLNRQRRETLARRKQEEESPASAADSPAPTPTESPGGADALQD